MEFETERHVEPGTRPIAGPGAMRIRDLFPSTPPIEPADRKWVIAGVILPSIALAVVAVLWLSSIGNLDLTRITDYGLVSVLPVAYFAALVLVAASFALTVHQRRAPSWLLFLHVASLIVIIHGTPSISYGALRYAWAWKHVGMVDYIQRFGAVDTRIAQLAELSANHNWPGFFALGTLFTEAGGFATALDFASWAPLFFNLIDIGAILMIAGAFVQDRRLKWTAVWVFFLGNWIGQDYFAPQALTYFLYLVVLGICLVWFKSEPRSRPGTAKLWARFEAWWARLGAARAPAGEAEWPMLPGQRAVLMGVIILLLAVIVTSHQLTPFMAILGLSALVVGYRLKARGLPVLLAVMTATWMGYFAWTFVGGNLQWILHPLGDIDRNARVSELSTRSEGQVVVALAARMLTAAIGLLAFGGLLRRWRLGQRDLSCLLLALAPFPMLAASSYGGEMLLRTYFFALPFSAFFAAALVYPSFSSGRSWRAPVLVFSISLLLLVGLLFAYYGREKMNYFTPEEVEAAHFLYDHAPANSLIVSASDNYPSLFQNYEQYDTITLSGQKLTRTQRQGLTDRPVETIAAIMDDPARSASFLFITRSQRAAVDLNQSLPPGAVDNLDAAIKRSAIFRTIFQNRDAEILILSGSQGALR